MMGKKKEAGRADKLAKASTQIEQFGDRLKVAAKAALKGLRQLCKDQHVFDGLKALTGLKVPNCNPSWAHVGVRKAFAEALFRELLHHDVPAKNEPVGLIEIVDECWDASSVAAIVDTERVRKDSRARLKKLTGKADFTSIQQVRLLGDQPHAGGGATIESRVLALVCDRATILRAKEGANSLNPQMATRTRLGDAITVREIGTRKRDVMAAIITMLEPSDIVPADGDASVADPLTTLRMLQVRSALLLKQTCIGTGKAGSAVTAALKHAEGEAKRLAKKSEAGVHRDGVPHFTAAMNVALGQTEWRVPLAKNRK